MEPRVKARSDRMFAKLTPSAKLKVQQAADRLLQSNSPQNKARQVTFQAFPTLANSSTADIDAVVFIVMSQAASDSQSDLQAVMSNMQAINAQKANLRNQINKVNSLIDSEKPKAPRKPYHFKLALTPHLRLAYPILPPVKELPKNLPTLSQSNLQALLEQLQEEQNALADMSTQDQMMLQQAMQQASQFEEMLSNMLKSMSDTDSAIINNIK
jgi:hypothetical protein